MSIITCPACEFLLSSAIEKDQGECHACRAGRLAAKRPLVADTMANGIDFAVAQERIKHLETQLADAIQRIEKLESDAWLK